MALFLVQHGVALPKDVDPDPGLSQKGQAEVQRIADVAKGYEVTLDRIIHSGKKRALETAEIFAMALGPARGVHQADGLKPLDDVAAFYAGLDSEEDVMLVGHLPFMSRLAGWLVNGNPDMPVFAFQNGGIVCLERRDSRYWIVKWSLSPRIG